MLVTQVCLARQEEPVLPEGEASQVVMDQRDLRDQLANEAPSEFPETPVVREHPEPRVRLEIAVLLALEERKDRVESQERLARSELREIVEQRDLQENPDVEDNQESLEHPAKMVAQVDQDQLDLTEHPDHEES